MLFVRLQYSMLFVRHSGRHSSHKSPLGAGSYRSRSRSMSPGRRQRELSRQRQLEEKRQKRDEEKKKQMVGGVGWIVF